MVLQRGSVTARAPKRRQVPQCPARERRRGRHVNFGGRGQGFPGKLSTSPSPVNVCGREMHAQNFQQITLLGGAIKRRRRDENINGPRPFKKKSKKSQISSSAASGCSTRTPRIPALPAAPRCIPLIFYCHHLRSSSFHYFLI